MTIDELRVYDFSAIEMARLRLTAALRALGCTVCVLSLAGCPTVDLGDTPPEPGVCRPDPVYYRDVIWPDYIAPADMARSCVAAAGCHRQSDGRSALRLSVAEPIDHDFNYTVVTRFLNCGTPEGSSMLSKPLDSVDPHGGGDLFAPGSMPEMVFLEWFNQ